MRSHSHKFKFDSQPANSHSHRIMGYTENLMGINVLHFHYFYGISSYNSHTHYFSGMTGLPIKTENGHVHKIECLLELNSNHEHQLSGFTFEDVAYTSKKLPKEAFV